MKTRRKQKFAPAGQSTQMIVGADTTNDDGICGPALGFTAAII